MAAPTRKASKSLVAAGLIGALSLVMLVVGAGAALVESSNHSVCSSGLGQLAQAIDQGAATGCAVANFAFYGGGFVAILGTMMFVAALVLGVAGAARRA